MASLPRPPSIDIELGSPEGPIFDFLGVPIPSIRAWRPDDETIEQSKARLQEDMEAKRQFCRKPNSLSSLSPRR